MREQAWLGAIGQVPYGIVASGLVMVPPEPVAYLFYYFRNSSWLTKHHLGAASAPRSSALGSILRHSSSVSCRVTRVTQLEADAAEAGLRTSSDSGFYR